MAKAGQGAGAGPLSASLERLVRARIAEIMSAAGVDQGRIGLEVLWDMPPDFIRAYEWLWRLICEGELVLREARNDAEVGKAQDAPAGRMGGGAQGRTRDTEKSRAVGDVVVVRSGGSARRGVRGAARGGTAHGVAGHGLEDVAQLKERIDKRLRGMARDIAEELKEVVGLDVVEGERVVKLDVKKVGEMRAGLQRAVDRGRDDASTIDD